MKKRILKVVGILLGICLLYILFLVGRFIVTDYRNPEPVTDAAVYKINNVETVREITGIKDFPEFDINEVCYDDSLRQNPELGCIFKKKMTDEEYLTFLEKCDTTYWKNDKDATIFFEKEWVCNGDTLFVNINKLSRRGFYLYYCPLKQIKTMYE